VACRSFLTQGFTMHFIKLSIVSAAILASSLASATTFKWSSASDIPTMDIHSQNNALGNGVHAAFYESLVYYNSRSFKVEPVLATAWSLVTPTQMRLTLRQGVKFTDGSAFTADDAVFSINRAMSKQSNFGVYAQGIDKVVKVNDSTIDLMLKGPNPVLLNQLTELRMMSKAWAEKNKSVEVKDIKTKDETFAHRNAMGTGPFMVDSWQPDQKLVLKRNPNWWGQMEGNITEIVYSPIKTETTRAAALLSGEVDMVLDPSPQDLPRMRASSALKVVDGAENRTIFFGMDQFRDELVGSNIKGKNPLKDVRVRKALYQAIDAGPEPAHRRPGVPPGQWLDRRRTPTLLL
jgi:peptide/nickel transport system substrate-binding protein